MLTSVTWVDVCVAALALFLVKQLLPKRRSAPLPPGPKGLPLVGNMFDMPKSHDWVTHKKWGEQYGKSYLGKNPSVFITSPKEIYHPSRS
jgi:hypothetical protein